MASSTTRFLTAVVLAFSAAPLFAGDLYWDANGTSAGIGGTGTWTASSLWRTNDTNGTRVTWPNSGTNNAFLGGDAGTVTIGSTAVTLGTGTAFFTTDGYVLATDATNTRSFTGNIDIDDGLQLKVFNVSSGSRSLSIGGNISGGTLAIVGPTSGGGSGTSFVSMNRSNTTISSSLVLSNNSGRVGLIAAASGIEITGPVSISGSTMLGATAGSTLTLGSSAVITGGANLQFATASGGGGSGTILLNSQSTYTTNSGGQGTKLDMASNGVVKLGTNNALPVASIFTIGVNSGFGGILDLNGFDQTVNSLSSGTGALGGIRNNGATAATLTADGTNSTLFRLAISDGTGGIALNKTGTGTLNLNAHNNYSGATTVEEGRLSVYASGSLSNSIVTVEDGGEVGGRGTIGGLIVNSGGTISPGGVEDVYASPVGRLTVTGGATWNPGGSFNLQLDNLDDGSQAPDYSRWDSLSIGGALDLSALTIGSEFNINLWTMNGEQTGLAPNWDPTVTNTYTFATAAGGITGYTGTGQFIVNTAAVNGTGGFLNPLDGGTFSVVQNGNDLNLVFTAGSGPEPVPEPGTWAAAALLVGGAVFARWRRRR